MREKNYLRLKEQVVANKARFLAGAINKTILAESEARLARANSQLIEASLTFSNSIEQYMSHVGETPQNLVLPSEINNIPRNQEDALLRTEKYSLNIALAKLDIALNKAQYNSLLSSVMPNITTSLSGSVSESTRLGNSDGLTLSLLSLIHI